MKLLLLQGPNLELLGKREPSLYGATSFSELANLVKVWSDTYQVDIIFQQTNSEAECLAILQQEVYEGMIFNPAAWTHTSVAIRDAILANKIKFIEVHLSNVYKREQFRQHSYFSDIAEGCIVGLGINGYEMGIKYFSSQHKFDKILYKF